MTTRLPRGLRNNNPGNIRKSRDKWQGLSTEQPDAEFFSFTAPEYGIRALTKILLNYQAKYGLNTVRKFISRWAPPNENNTDAYVKVVASAMGINPDTPITLSVPLLKMMVPAIIKHENGQQPYSDALIAKGISLAVKNG